LVYAIDLGSIPSGSQFESGMEHYLLGKLCWVGAIGSISVSKTDDQSSSLWPFACPFSSVE
jgi:hypothetical protein